MDGKINNDHRLEIKRAGTYLLQDCVRDKDQYYCVANSCPLFSEPEPETKNEIRGGATFAITGRTVLNICQQKTLIFENFIDERITEPNHDR